MYELEYICYVGGKDYAEDVREIFTDPKGYKGWYERNRVIYMDELALVKSFNLSNCLDLGSGPGIFHEAMSGETVSIDVSVEMLREVEGDKVQGDVRALPFRDRAFECVFSSVTVCFVDDIETFFKEAARVSKGTVTVCFIPLDSSWGRFYSDLGKRGHKYYSKAIFRPLEEILNKFRKYMKVDVIKSTITFKPGDVPKEEPPVNGLGGSFICVSGPPLTVPATGHS